MAADSASELQSVAHAIARLQELLQRARGLKPEATVNPPLQTADLASEINALHAGIDEHYEQSYRFNVVDAAARRLFYTLIYGINIEDAAFVQVWDFLDILLLCGDRGICAPELVPWLVEELLESQTTTGCRTVFDYLESRRERLWAKDFNKKKLACLRFCNELLRRLSRAEDAMFCGRVFFFLFQTFPIGDKSSVNLRGDFHVENTTKFEVPEGAAMNGDDNDKAFEGENAITKPENETPKPPTQPRGKAIPARAVPTPAKKSVEETLLTNDELYPIFWRLQADFSDPTRLFDHSNFETFQKSLGHTLLKFKKTPTVVQTKVSPEMPSKRGTKRKQGDEDGPSATEPDELSAIYNPKYLTSRDLFDLELSDLAFQRHILLQSLILLSFLLSLTATAKTKLASTLETTNKSMIYPLTLSKDDAEWCEISRLAIKNFLTHLPTGEQGRFYDRMVETVLARDRNWVRWKAEGCPSIVREAVGIDSVKEAGKGAMNATRARRVPERGAGVLDLGFLIAGGGLDALRNPSRFAAPDIADLVQGAKGDELDLEMAMDEQEQAGLKSAISSKTWRALRQVRERQLVMLDRVEVSGDLEVVLGEDGSKVDEEVNGEHEDQDGADVGADSIEVDVDSAEHVVMEEVNGTVKDMPDADAMKMEVEIQELGTSLATGPSQE
ncbi:hypothetical protein LTR62_007657 [Meristemomyces frigidus]|uniref:Nuclear matrix protein n=1 Tax=Meristemomyces frigidus TaxID=1508187 RepID=A0AAN7TBU7_9PEZI|nr:hypothetical protein LTR62_007657 [Meristemomyces frigidus]